ncbi:tRNA (adenosine(37)-N6)-threonylcarbamoyltransferase complex dimerization subunit type 1 TsaB [Flavicella marina]|uniref:tRNA (adenosine(37)-N6)-threonylcarbamoyltransferase complex dimerization subunit type 1 TsaB n=1 Tax=Flavicella marina TaxID=1475951 RepID=UPI0012644C96|nr:tRNA (adenosine(37)-N6)-threonylcarbamoyltransferase complex dimerization subunit type 1 TsaB [Flavicella marina]
MSYILNFDTATKNCSVSIGRNGEMVAFEEVNTENYSHSEKLHLFVENVLQKAQIEFSDLAAVCVGKGPGSYTGLRIGVSAAKGICFALDIPLISLESLEILANSITINEGVVIPMLDARRLEVFSAVFDKNGLQIRGTKAEVLDENSYDDYLSSDKVYFVGDAVKKTKDIIIHKNAIFIESKFPSALDMVTLSEKKYKNAVFEDVAYFEPYYLKDFVGVKPKKRI